MTKFLRLLGVSALLLANLAPFEAFAAVTPSAAATNLSFQVSPPTANYPADPGATVAGNIKVTNLTGIPITLAVGKENFVAKGEEGEIELVDNGDPLYSLAPWFNLSASQIDVPARATKVFNYTIAVPANAEPGGRYGSITFHTIAAKLPSGESGATVEQQLAPIVFLRINGAANEKLSVASFTSDKSFYEYGPVQLVTRVKNSGTVHEKPTGTITIKNVFGFTVATLPLDEHYVIPGAIRKLKNSWPSSNKKTLLFGHYTAKVDATYANGQKLSATTSFTVIPYTLIAIVLIVLLVIILIFWRGRKRFRRALRILAGRE